MGMIGCYVAVDDDTAKRIADGELDIFELDEEKYPTLDIDKTWEAICYMLTGDICEGEPPLSYVVPLLDDNALDVDMDFGAFYLTSERVKEGYEAIKNMGEAELKSIFSLERMKEDEIYPVTEDEDKEGFFSYVYQHFQALKEFYKSTSESGKNLIFYIS